MKKSLPAALYFTILFLYLEIVFHLLIFRSMDSHSLFLILFSGMSGGALAFLFSFFHEKAGFILTLLITILACIFFCVQLIYQAVFQRFLTVFSMLGVADQAFDFMDVISKNLFMNLFGIFLLILPVPLLILAGKYRILSFAPLSAGGRILTLFQTAACYGAAVFMLLIGTHASYSPYDVYFHNISADMTAEYFGVVTMTRLDGLYAIFGKPSKSLLPAAGGGTSDDGQAKPSGQPVSVENEPAIDTSPNILDIDFDAVQAASPNENVTMLTTYFRNQAATDKNEYTGMFKGYNVIFITAEGFSRFVIDETRTPTLYRLKNEGFVFNHFYTPGWYASTSGGEYANLTGLLPADGIVSMKRTGKQQNDMRFTLGRQLERLGYTVNGYHNNSYTYYGRDISHPNMGYNWHGTGNWFVPEMNANGKELWPQSDLQLIEQSMADYMDHEPFHTYYMTVSGHMLYNFTGNQMSARNYASVQNLSCSDTAKAYLACQEELEKGMSALVSELEKRGIADHTVIVLSADHIPYNDKAVCDELAGYELESAIEWYQNDLIIWSGSMEEPVTVDKYCYNADILPTISNLLGLPYDSRLLAGQDILSDSAQLVCFPDRSFISDKCIYHASNGSVTSLTGEEVTQEYLNNLSNIVYNKFVVSEMVLNENYYQYLQD